jgi:hypothetical protein
MLLCLSQLEMTFALLPFGPFFLWYRIVCADQGCLTAISTGVHSIAAYLTQPSVKEFVFFLALNNRTNLAAMTRVTGSFDGSGHVFNGSGALPNNTTQSSNRRRTQ